MKQIITIANTKPWCPYCANGYMLPLAVTLETTPEVEPDVEFLYGCNDCHKTLAFTISDMEIYGTNSIGIALFQAIGKANPK